MKKLRNFDWLRAVRLIPNSTVCYHSENFCYHGGKNKFGGQITANSGNISLKFEVSSTLILPAVKCPLTKLEES